jgi:hypothetical protein
MNTPLSTTSGDVQITNYRTPDTVRNHRAEYANYDNSVTKTQWSMHVISDLESFCNVAQQRGEFSRARFTKKRLKIKHVMQLSLHKICIEKPTKSAAKKL